MPDRFSLAFPPGVTVGKWTRIFTERHPRVELLVIPSADPLVLLAEGGADIAFVRDSDADDRRHLIPLYSEEIVAVVHHEHLLTREEETKTSLADLDGEPCVSGEPSEALMRRIAAGDGLALMPASLAKAFRRKDVVALRLEDAPISRVGLSWLREGQHPLVDEFIGIVRGRTAHSSRNPEVAAAQRSAAVPARSPRPARATPKRAATPSRKKRRR